MLRSMYAGISGMKANQTKMDVVGNNVANVGTTAYKKTGARFSDALYQNMIYSSAPGGGIGGVNPGQVGIGTKVSGIFKNMVQGAIQPTGRPTDLAIDGDGLFRVQLGEGDNYGYTRDGSFNLDEEGYLVTAEGYYVLGQTIKPNDGDKVDDTIKDDRIKIPKSVDPVTGKEDNTNGKKVISFNISKDGKISYLVEDGTKVPQLEKVDPATGKPVIGADGKPEKNVDARQPMLDLVVFTNPEGLEALGGNIFTGSANSGDAIRNNKLGKINQGAVEMSNVDLSEEFTEMIVTTRAFQAASKVITTSDELLQEIINLKR
ncbi:flagellar hook-basal body protein [Romboutsia sp.]|uniref:flagellar hook-basal body protein n=1 Tax=Romboutsia sp. TaxID=1965302 RepID=UPI003F37ADFC